MDDRAISPRDAAAPWGVVFLLLAGVTLAEALLWLAEAEAGAGHLAEAVAAYERAADVAAAAFGPRHAELATYLTELGIFRFDRRNYPAAVPVFERARASGSRRSGSTTAAWRWRSRVSPGSIA